MMQVKGGERRATTADELGEPPHLRGGEAGGAAQYASFRSFQI